MSENCVPYGLSPLLANPPELAPVSGNLRTRCCKCGQRFYIRPSISMQMGSNSGHCTCTNCRQFLHVEILEGDEAWSEAWEDYLKRTKV